jgi:hypothetical protein
MAKLMGVRPGDFVTAGDVPQVEMTWPVVRRPFPKRPDVAGVELEVAVQMWADWFEQVADRIERAVAFGVKDTPKPGAEGS